jgi:hypothetical protein
MWDGNAIKYIRDVDGRNIQILKTFIPKQADRTGQIKHQLLPYNNAYLLKANNPEVL